MLARARFLIPFIMSIIIAAILMSGYFWYVQRQKDAPLPKINHTIKHLGIIMDGNRRWAKKQGLAAWLGHQKGTDPVKLTVEFCVEQNIPYLTLYALSLENLKRSQEELDHLFEIIKKGLTNDEFEKLMSNGVKVNIIGDRSLFPQSLATTLDDIQEKTKNGTRLTLNILFCYGGQQEITAAVQTLCSKVEKGGLKVGDITPELIQQQLWTQGPPADLIIRTGGCHRLSNFLTWQSAYSELMFTDVYWPDISKKDLHDSVTSFTNVKRNFGA